MPYRQTSGQEGPESLGYLMGQDSGIRSSEAGTRFGISSFERVSGDHLPTIRQVQQVQQVSHVLNTHMASKRLLTGYERFIIFMR